jgi:glycosyltransferase involved in cell wall biosynthesis
VRVIIHTVGGQLQLKVRFVTRKWPPAVGGMETYCVRMTEELTQRCDLETIALPGKRDGRPPSGMALLGFGLVNALRAPFRQRVDVAHMADMALWPLGLLELLLRRARHLLLSAHGSDVSMIKRPGAAAKVYQAYLKLGATFLPDARIVANSTYTADLARSVGFAKVDVVPLGTDICEIRQPGRSGLLFAGRITRAKGLRFLVEEVMPLLQTRERLRVAGTVWEESERSLLDNPAVEYLGPLTQEQLQVEYSRTLVTLVPSQVAEGFGLVAIEAAACGSQVIASRAGGLLDVVREPWGELVDPKDPIEWARAIDARCSSVTMMAGEISRAAVQDVDQLFRWADVAERTLQKYEGERSARGRAFIEHRQ